jgi:putative PIN family toxin of toxin-antitoxin system
MRVVLDTNVFVSGVFFSGIPGKILEAWRDGRITLVTSPKILDEYRRVGDLLSARYEGVDLQPFLSLVATAGLVVEDLDLPQPVSDDPDDDKFLASARAAGAETVVSGDKHLIGVSAWHGIEVLTPRKFHDRYLTGK